jgi:hypothetical protein
MAQLLMIRGRPPKSTAVALLQAQGLPVSDITDEHLEHFFFIGSDGSPTGLEDYAASRSVAAMFLLTTKAERFFERRGYRRVDRSQAPLPIQSTPEFASLCPASSAFMIKQL